MTEEASSSRELLFPEYILSPSIFPKMSREEKEEFVKQLYHSSEKAERLQSLKRNDIIELINIEMGTERTLTNIPKPQLINLLCNIISEKVNREEKQVGDSTHPAALSDTLSLPPFNTPTASRSKRKSSHPSRLHKYCQNSSCRAEMKLTDAFCKRCSCYICFNFDENKNPSFWLVCESETRLQDKPCGLSCHIECALKNERVGNMGNVNGRKLDGSFQCGTCGTVNDLISCWRKLLKEAKDVRRVSDLCSRIYLSHMILNSTKKYHNLHGIVDSMKRKLENEVGSLNNLPLDMSRGLVRRLSVGAEVQKLCSLAIELLDTILLAASQFNRIKSQNHEGRVTNESNLEGGINVPVPEIKVDESENKDMPVIDLNELPENDTEDYNSTDVELEDTRNETAAPPISTCDSILAVPPPLGIEECNKRSKGKAIELGALHTVKNAEYYKDKEYYDSTDGELGEARNEIAALPISTCDPILPILPPLRIEECSDGSREKPVKLGALHMEKNADDYMDTKYRQAVNVIKQLECDGHIDSSFRKEFITWLSIRASPKSTSQVSVLIDTFSDDSQTLADQLVHTFGEEIRARKFHASLNRLE